MYHHIRSWRRHINWVKAIRKRRIDRAICPSFSKDLYDNLHQYSKNKIHCSCGMCRSKSKNKGKHRKISRNYAPSINLTIKDLRRQQSMDDSEFDYYNF